ncbi:MAG: hypothetical protein ACRDQ4_17850 [Pseudonocardiaceae bacterium]
MPMSATAALFFDGSSSPWTTPVPPDANADPRSAEYAAQLTQLKPTVSVSDFTVSVFVASTRSPHYTIRPTAWWTPPGYMLRAPIPDDAQPDPADGHLVVLDSPTQCVYEFYRARRTSTSWTAEWANAIPANGNGIYPDGLSTRASGISSAAGLIWPEELRSGVINHALVFAYPFTRTGGPVGLATNSDGYSTNDAALPIGAHLVLDPTINIDALPLTPTDKTIAKALQRYGMILAGTSGGLTLYAVQPTSFAADPYASIWPEQTHPEISQIPFNHMKVLPLGNQMPRYQGPPIPNRCTAPPHPPR